MSVATMQPLPSHSAIAAHRSSPDEADKPSGFTAVNGRSPSHGPHATDESNRTPDRLDLDSPTKRKFTELDGPIDLESKRSRLSPVTTPLENGHVNGHSEPWRDVQRRTSDTSEAKLAEALKKNMSDIAPAPEIFPGSSTQHSPYSMDDKNLSAAAQMQRANGQRKRTKTGCLTCRERKKKCDEAKPTCTNCARGGFNCKGYAPNTTFKPANAGQPPIQPVQPYGHQFYGPAQQPPYHEHGPPHMHHPHHPPPPPHAAPYPAPAWNGYPHQPIQQAPGPPGPQGQPGPPGPPAPYQDQMHRPDYPVLHHPGPKVPPPEPVHVPYERNNSHPSFSGFPARVNGGSYSHRMTAQAALEKVHEPSTAKGKMMGGFPFNPRDPELKKEQEECAKSVLRFNKTATEIGLHSDAARRDLLRRIFEPSDETGAPKKDTARGRTHGKLGTNAEVEAPFNCTYGYNINIGEDVEIGPNCRIIDAMTVDIGARTIIGPNVTILTQDGCHEPEHRPPGQKRLMRAKHVRIGDDVFIGAGAIILPGMEIGNGATIGAGTIVHRNKDEELRGPSTIINDNKQRIMKRFWQYKPPSQIRPP